MCHHKYEEIAKWNKYREYSFSSVDLAEVPKKTFRDLDHRCE